MYNVENMLTKLPQLNSYKILWKKGFPQYGKYFIIFSTLWKVKFVCPTLGRLQCRFSTIWKEWFRIFYKIRSKKSMFYNMQGEYSALQLDLVFRCSWCLYMTNIAPFVMPKMSKMKHNKVCKKMTKIPLLLSKDFGKNVTLSEGFKSIPCLLSEICLGE